MTEPPSLREFLNRFPDEKACREHFRQQRWGDDGFECPDCAETEDWTYLESRDVFQCNACRKQTSITAGTILQDTKLDLRTWFLAIYHVLATKKGITIPELARKLDVTQETAHNLRQKVYRILRHASGDRTPLTGAVEADETYVGGTRSDERGRGTSKPEVVALVEARGPHAGGLHLEEVEVSSRTNVHPLVHENVDEEAQLKTDDREAYDHLDVDHEIVQPDWEEDEHFHDVLPWSHILFSNLKRVLYGVHAYVEDWNIQPYLDAFSYRFNHRGCLEEGLEKALRSAATTPPYPTAVLKRSGEAAA
jgi:transposase-like protein